MFVMLVSRGVYQIPKSCGEGFFSRMRTSEPAIYQTPLGMTGRWLGRLGTDRYTVYFTIFILNAQSRMRGVRVVPRKSCSLNILGKFKVCIITAYNYIIMKLNVESCPRLDSDFMISTPKRYYSMRLWQLEDPSLVLLYLFLFPLRPAIDFPQQTKPLFGINSVFFNGRCLE